MKIHRRSFVMTGLTAAGTLGLGAPAVLGQAKPRVVVIGGGAGGATAARYIAKDSQGAIAVTLVEENETYQTCFHSNLYVGGFKTYEEISHRYDALTKNHGITLARARATQIDRDKKEVVLSTGQRLPYDRLVVSPGIDLKYDSVPGWSKEVEEQMPHGWKPGRQTQLIKQRLDAVPNGGTIVMIAPPNPYRCPPGPYERASMFAHVLQQAGKKDAKVIILDPKESFSKQGVFQADWEKRYGSMIEWLGPKVHDGIKSVDPKTNTVVTGFETYKDCAFVNVIPAQMAGEIARSAGLAPAGGYCAIDAATMKSTADANIFVLGDACIAGDMPKSAFSANSQAKVAAMTIRGELTSARTFPARYVNTCWSLVAPDDTIKVGGRYEPKDGKIAATETFVSKPGESAELRKENQAENMGWYAGITADMFS
ncbi:MULTISPECIES: FCSD flavin-binding domain-containing protein [Bosea]|jgi:NADPH-dependent 2,4-dienoyl-CoA reductase/sulfur reductase-like enzyme|uniref:FCSD flavin-binding domain-containing protein n=1 Tax=Bosea rubneri TaxID=3075434 RepID=A0ABU3S488_9HYPH|nr:MULTISPECIES: FCSD flavin-binding domain-containing protein [unclassified Bosea (in: a-proteobacteria)]MDU0339583.1 FCSD flavin-binding domain-containing protein [Bosea sp. ZW T0_25]HEV7336736.1 FCSD flavin-binding domain-containing protein [Bosea sp. (in: a-proteobacteria)]